MKIKNIKIFRKLFKEKVRVIKDENRNENFIGHSFPNNNSETFGFFEIYHGQKSDIHKFITPFLTMAQDTQAVYELIQNANDSDSKTFALFFDDEYFLAFNDGKQFDFEGIQSILNIAQSTKDSNFNIGKFGIGFKIVHKLLGETSGKEELFKYNGPILFSWNSINDLLELSELKSASELDPVSFEINRNGNSFSCIDNYPWLFKILLTNFPCGIKDNVLNLELSEKNDLFSENELLKLSLYVRQKIIDNENINLSELTSGSIIFLKLGREKNTKILQDHVVNGINSSISILDKIYEKSEGGIKKIILNNEVIFPGNLKVLSIKINQQDDLFETIVNSETGSERPDYIEYIFGYPNDINDTNLKSSPNIYLYFPLGDEQHNYNFIIHCNIFDNLSQRTNLSELEINYRILNSMSAKLIDNLKDLENSDFKEYCCIFASILNSDKSDKKNKLWVNEYFYDPLLNFIKSKIPNNKNSCTDKEKVRIKKTQLEIDPYDFGVDKYNWFYFSGNKDLENEARNNAKLNLSNCSLFNLINDSTDIDKINTWMSNNLESYEIFINELEFSFIDNDTFKNKLNDLMILKYSNSEFKSIKNIVNKEEYLICHNLIDILKPTLCLLGFRLTDFNFSKYPNINNYLNNHFEYLKNKNKLFSIISSKTQNNKLSAENKKQLFLSFIDIDKELLFKCKLFRNVSGEIKSIEELITPCSIVPDWLNCYKIDQSEYFNELNDYLLNENLIYSKIIVPYWNEIISSTSVINDPAEFYKKVIEYYLLDENKLEINEKVVLSSINEFKTNEEIFYNSNILNFSEYEDLEKILKSYSNLTFPDIRITPYLDKQPFNMKDNNILDVLNYPIYLNEGDMKLLISYLNESKEEIFSKILIENKDKNYLLIKKIDNYFQYSSNCKNTYLHDFISEKSGDKYCILPGSISDLIINKANILNEQEILKFILSENYDPNDIFEIFINSDSENIKIEFLDYITELTLNASFFYDENSYEFIILKLVLKYFSDDESRLNEFREKIYIESNGKFRRKLSEIAINNKVKFNLTDPQESYDLDLSKILPSYIDKSGLIESVINNFKGFNEYDLRNKIFNVGKQKRKEEILNEMSSELINAHQFAFIILMMKFKDDINFMLPKIICNTKIGKTNLVNNDYYYLNYFEFINKKNLLCEEYQELSSLLKLNDDKPFIETGITISICPYIYDEIYNCYPLKKNLDEDNKAQSELLISLFDEYSKQKIKPDTITFMETNYISNEITVKSYKNDNKQTIIGFNPEQKIYPIEYAIEIELLPEWIINWIQEGNQDQKFEFLKTLGLNDENSDIVKLRKHLKGEIEYFDKSLISNMPDKFIDYTIKWLFSQNLEYKSESNQLECLVELVKKYDDTEILPIIILNTIIENKIILYNLSQINYNGECNSWILEDLIIDKLYNLGDQVLLNINTFIKSNNGNLIYEKFIDSNKISKYSIPTLQYELILDSKYLFNCMKEFEKEYYMIWRHELNYIYKIFINQNVKCLKYDLILKNTIIQSIDIENEIDIDNDGNIFILSSENIEELLERIIGKNGFEKCHIDLLKEKKVNEPEEIAKQFDDLYSEPEEEILRKISENTNLYFPENENIKFESKLIELLDISNSPWGKGYVFHFTHLENAVKIINNRNIFSRNKASEYSFTNSASNEQINRTRNFVHEYARFYFRPQTPTQWHNEGLGRNKYLDNPKCPIPIFFKIKVEDILKNNKDKCFVSNGNLSSHWANYGNSYEFLKKIDFINLYSKFGNNNYKIASQQEFIIHDYLNIEDLPYEIICRTEEDKESLTNLIDENSNLNIKVDTSYYHQENPFICHKRNHNISDIYLSKNSIIDCTLKLVSNSKIEFKTIDGNFFKYQNDKECSLEFKINSNCPCKLEFKSLQDYKLYYIDETNFKWFIYSTNNLK